MSPKLMEVFYDGIDNYERSHPNWANGNLIEVARAMVEAQIAATPQLVGPPISILLIQKQGPNDFTTRWIQGGACGESLRLAP